MQPLAVRLEHDQLFSTHSSREPAAMIGDRLQDRYELVAELGRGGRGVVYKGFDTVLHREVAVKMIPPRQLDREAEERFSREALLIARMDHPGIVPIYDYGRHRERLFLVMPLVEGTTLKQLIRRGELTLSDTLGIAAQVAEALDYSHRLGVVHRDVKPSNVMVTRTAEALRVRVMDFGMAQASGDPRLTDTGNLPGTLFYLSPEQVLSQPLDGRSDLYAVGAVLYECLSGQPPFTGQVYKVLYSIVHEQPRPLRPPGVTLPPALEQLVLGCLAKSPEARPADGRELARMLHSLLEGSDSLPTTPPPELAPPTPQRTRVLGREDEMAELERRLRSAVHGECQLVLVGGEAGIGKTRLLDTLAALARGWRVQVLRGHFSGRDDSFPHQGLCELIQDFFRLQGAGGSSGTQVSGETPELSDLAPRLVALFPQLAEIPELRTSGSTELAPGEATPTEPRSTDVFELIAATLARLLGGRPALFLLESLHRAEASLAALEYLVRRLGPTPTLIVATYRSDELAEVPGLTELAHRFADDPRFAHLQLGALAEEALETLLAELLGSPAADPELAHRLGEASEGNPLFFRELVGALLESGELACDGDGRWQLAAGAAPFALALPASVQQTLERRLERLAEPLRELLAIASVLGRSFSERELEELVENSGQLDTAIDELLHRGILEEERKTRGQRLCFASGVLRDLLYHALPRRRRRALHRRCAELLETQHAGRLDRVYPRLVHHCARGGVIEKTVVYARDLARCSLEVSSPEEAATAVTTALELVETEAAPLDPLTEAELLALRARARRQLGQVEATLRDGERASELLEASGELARAAEAALLVAETAWHARRVETARSWVERGTELAHRGQATPVLRRLLSLGATLANLRGEHAAAATWLEELERIEQLEQREQPAPGAASAGQGAGELVAASGGRLVAGLASPITTLDPGRLATDEEAEVAMCVFETLLGSDTDGHLLPALCESWQAHDDARVFVLHLRRGVRFSDGTPLTAAEVAASLARSARLRAAEPAPALAALAATEATDEHVLRCRLHESLPIFPALLTDNRLAVARERADDELVGTGPFRIARQSAEEVVLARNPLGWHPAPARLDELVFQGGLGAPRIADLLRSGELDLGRDLLPADLETLTRDARFRRGMVDATRKNIYYVLFNQNGPNARHRELRRALAGVARSRALVWRSLGRLAQPAVGLIPPGVLGHDPGRRNAMLAPAEAAALIDAAGLERPIVLRAAVHPRLQDRYGALTRALFQTWADLGIEVEMVTGPMAEFLATYRDHETIDLQLGRWNTDYDDPDNFTWIFHSQGGIYRRYCSSPAIDRLLEAARRESQQAARQRLYQQLEDHLAGEAALIPLFHDVDYRLGGPRVQGLRLRNTYPYVDYARLGRVAEASREPAGSAATTKTPAATSSGPRLVGLRSGALRIPITNTFDRLEPLSSNTADQFEAGSCVFETLTRLDEGARVVPWLASAIEFSTDGRGYRFQLRPNVRFHDGRRLSARDVRATFERLLLAAGNPLQAVLDPIRGARALRRGETSELEGFHLRSALDFTLELEQPLPFFLALLTHPALAILPEDACDLAGSWRAGLVGTGPFRVVHFETGELLDLEPNPGYWRTGMPRSERLLFDLGSTPEQNVEGLRSGRLALADGLRRADMLALRRSRELANCYVEAPRLSTCFLAFNTLNGPLADAQTRRALADALDVEVLLRQTPGTLPARATGLIPPGLLGWEPVTPPPARPTQALRGLELRVGAHPMFLGPYAELWQRVCGALTELGIELVGPERSLFGSGSASDLHLDDEEVAPDLAAVRWIADYPDADGFVAYLLGSEHRSLPELAANPELEQLGMSGRHESDPALRHATYRRIEELIARERLLVPLFHEQTYRFHQPQLCGLRLGFTIPEVRYEELYWAG